MWGQSSHRERIVSTAQSSWLPSSCAWPVSLGSSGHGGICVYVWVGICIGVCHPSGVEQLFYLQGSESFLTSTHSPAGKGFTYFSWEDGEELDHLALSLFSTAASNLCVIDSVLCSAHIFWETKRGEACVDCHTTYMIIAKFFNVKVFTQFRTKLQLCTRLWIAKRLEVVWFGFAKELWFLKMCLGKDFKRFT